MVALMKRLYLLNFAKTGGREFRFLAGGNTTLAPKLWYLRLVDISEGKGRLEAWKANFLNLVTFHASTHVSKQGIVYKL